MLLRVFEYFLRLLIVFQFFNKFLKWRLNILESNFPKIGVINTQTFIFFRLMLKLSGSKWTIFSLIINSRTTFINNILNTLILNTCMIPIFIIFLIFQKTNNSISQKFLNLFLTLLFLRISNIVICNMVIKVLIIKNC